MLNKLLCYLLFHVAASNLSSHLGSSTCSAGSNRLLGICRSVGAEHSSARGGALLLLHLPVLGGDLGRRFGTLLELDGTISQHTESHTTTVDKVRDGAVLYIVATAIKSKEHAIKSATEYTPWRRTYLRSSF
jgi:hypothetical protein